VVDVSVVEEGKSVEFDLVFGTLVDSPHCLIKGTRAGMVGAVVVMKFFGAVDADSHEEFVFEKEAAPVVVEQDSIGLECVAHLQAGGTIFFLKFDSPLVKIQAHESWFAALPGENGDRKTQRHVVFYKTLEDLVGHSLPPVSNFRCAVFVEAVFAVDVAVRTGRFYQKRKRLHVGLRCREDGCV